MFQGFYTLTSGMLTQTRNMNVVSNNMSNTSTPGFKSDYGVISDFGRVMMSRSDSFGVTNIGYKSNGVMLDAAVTNHTQGAVERTNRNLDFALTSQGYFAVQTNNGTVYTRNGSFTLDNEGYLYLSGVGRVLSTGGAPIQLGTDNITADSQGRIYNADTGALYGQLMVVNFENPAENLVKNDNGTFTALVGGTQINTNISWRSIENSNVEPIEQMTRMISGQRALQSSAQVMKIYDELISQMVNKLGPTQ